MIQKIKRTLTIVATALLVSAPGLVPATASAVAGCGNLGGGIADGANAATPNNGGGNIGACSSADATNANSQIGKLANNLVTIFSYVVGAISIIMIIYGGFRYITSGGESGAVGNAKNTIIYAIVGLIIVALAQVIVHFVLNQTSSATA